MLIYYKFLIVSLNKINHVMKTLNLLCFYRYADQVSVGDEVLVQEKDKFTPTKVFEISTFHKQGTYFSLFFCISD